ncbi:MAG: hypothetical protein ABI239_07050 [Aquihabitans sp.]
MIRRAGGGPVENGLSRTGPVTATASGPHGYVAGSARVAGGWSLSVEGDKVTATPGSDALIGNQATSVLPRPLPPISQGTGGDGHVPILMGTKVFAFFHHANPTQITCMDRATGKLCPGYPKTLPVSTGTAPGPAGIVGSQIWVHVQYSGTYTNTSGFFCWDTETNQTCGLVTGRLGAESWTGTPPVMIDGEMWFATGAGQLRCVDPATSAPCTDAPIYTAVTFGSDIGNIINNGTKVYVSNYSIATCIDVSTGERCLGWPEGGRSFRANLVRSHDATGAVDGVCGVDGYGMSCVRDADPDTVVHTPVGWIYGEYANSSSQEAEAGTRTFYGSHHVSGLSCFDWSTMAYCTGPNFDRWGGAHVDIGGNALPWAYGAVWDGSCAVGLGDQALLFTMDYEGNSPCVSLDSGAAPLKIDLRRQRFDQSVGAATWDQVRVLDTDLTAGTNFTSFLVTIRDAETGESVASQEMVDTDGVLDLSGIDPSEHPSLTVGATSRSVDGGEAWADGIAPKVQLVWNEDAVPLGFQTVALACFDDPTGALVVNSATGDQTARGEPSIDPLPRCTALPPVVTTPPVTTPGETPPIVKPDTETPTPPRPGDPAQPLGIQQGGPGQSTPTSATTPDVRETALARTGTAAMRMGLIGGIFLMCGAAIVLAARRRRVTR